MAILVCPLSQAERLIRDRKPGRVVSLLDPETPFPDAAGSAHLRLSIHDIDAHQHGWVAPQAEHMRELLTFIEAWDFSAPILVHCWAGVSRSTATALIAACLHNPRTDEEEIARALRRASPTATPNRRLIALADAELVRGGRLTAAAAAIGAGVRDWASFTEAASFELPARFEDAG